MAATSAMAALPGGQDASGALAFEEFTRPWRSVARRALAARLGDSLPRHLTEEGQRGLERALTSRLSDTLCLVLFGEFTAFRDARTTAWERLMASTGATPSRQLYDEFVRQAAAGGLERILRDYPVLADLAASLTDQWVDASAEMVERLDRDLDDLARMFGGAQPLGPVADAVAGLSDPHHGGRTVTILTFASGASVVYKPKDVGTEWAFGRLLAWLNQTGALPLELRAPGVLARPGYGWAERVQRTPCADEAALSRYYQRAGMLACVVYALAGFDCHRENIIASGEHPVLVDVECLLGHRPVMAPDFGGVHQIALDGLRSGVLGTGLLPSWQVDDEDGGVPRDISGLHVPQPGELIEQARRWEHVNTDAMALRVGSVHVSADRHVPVIAGGASSPPLVEHADDVLDGFSSCYRVFVRHREALLAANGPVAAFAGQRVRFLFRNTRVYGSLHHQLLHPRFLRDWADREAELQRLRRVLEEEGTVGRWGPLVDSEIEALNRCDVPHFTALPEGDILFLDGGATLEGCLREPSHRLVVERIRDMAEADLRQQLGFIAGSLHSEAARQDDSVPGGAPAGFSPGGSGAAVGSLLDAARALAREVGERAVRSGGAATWIAPQYLPRLERYQLQPVGLDWHSGGCGPALFLAAAAALTEDRTARSTALEAVRPVREALDRSPTDLRRALGSGGATGVGSVVYALVRCAALLEEDGLLETAALAADVIDDHHLATAELDVFAGMAGDLLGLLALHRATGDSDALARAVLCGDKLLESAQPTPRGGRSWRTLGSLLLTGFSHGAAGIVHALARLSEVTGRVAYADAARAGVRYEDATFDEAVGNWPDLREDEQPAFKVNWCHGAPGIGLARLGTWRSLGDPDLLHDVECAVATTLSLDLEGPDHLCCGNLGRSELLLAAGAQLGRDDLTEQARARAAAVVHRAGSDGGYRLHSSLPRRVHMPGFFMGLSGVGYALLRTAHPEVLPSALSWD